MTFDEAFKALERPSRNGYETTIAMIGWNNYHWSLIRYPMDLHDEEPLTEPIIFEGVCKCDKTYWSRALEQVTQYLENHPDDGFAY